MMSDDDASLLAAFRRTLASDPELAGLAAEPSADMTELGRLVRAWIVTHPDDEDAAERAALTQYLEHLTLVADRAGARGEG